MWYANSISFYQFILIIIDYFFFFYCVCMREPGMNECKPRMSQDCYDMISKKYYFYLSFENSLCKDYVTEKFFNVLEQPLIPVVYGGANYTQILPAKGYINALSFESPKSLAKELIRIASDPELYNSYFEWKSYFEQEPDPGWSCRLCSILHQPTTHRTRWTQLHHFWYDDANCIYPNYSF